MDIHNYTKVCRDLAEEHQNLFFTSCEFLPEVAAGTIVIRCKLCDIQIKPGLPKQRLANVRRHFQESDTHKSRIIAKGRDDVFSESVANLELKEAGKLELLNRVAPGVFHCNRESAVCTFCVGSSRSIRFAPEHGSFEHNVKTHLASKQHIRASKGKPQGTLDAMFAASAPASTVAERE